MDPGTCDACGNFVDDRDSIGSGQWLCRACRKEIEGPSAQRPDDGWQMASSTEPGAGWALAAIAVWVITAFVFGLAVLDHFQPHEREGAPFVVTTLIPALLAALLGALLMVVAHLVALRHEVRTRRD